MLEMARMPRVIAQKGLSEQFLAADSCSNAQMAAGDTNVGSTPGEVDWLCYRSLTYSCEYVSM